MIKVPNLGSDSLNNIPIRNRECLVTNIDSLLINTVQKGIGLHYYPQLFSQTQPAIVDCSMPLSTLYS